MQIYKCPHCKSSFNTLRFKTKLVISCPSCKESLSKENSHYDYTLTSTLIFMMIIAFIIGRILK